MIIYTPDSDGTMTGTSTSLVAASQTQMKGAFNRNGYAVSSLPDDLQRRVRNGEQMGPAEMLKIEEYVRRQPVIEFKGTP